MTYGFELSGDLHQRLRGQLPVPVLAWVEGNVGCRVVGQQPLIGGTSAAIHLVRLDGAEDVVVQRFVLDWILEEPWAPGNEVTVLELLAGTAVPAPRVIATDLDGQHTGAPTILMSALPGSLVWDPPDMDVWLDALVSTMQTIHAVPPPASGLSPWGPYAPEGVPPEWTQARWAWERAIAAYHSEHPLSDAVFLHRDFHPGNVLWRDGAVTGVVDWVSSCVGPPEEDVAHCRVNLARHHGQGVADEFLARWLRVSGRTDYHPYWDLVDVVSMGSATPDPRLDTFVAAAAAKL